MNAWILQCIDVLEWLHLMSWLHIKRGFQWCFWNLRIRWIEMKHLWCNLIKKSQYVSCKITYLKKPNDKTKRHILKTLERNCFILCKKTKTCDYYKAKKMKVCRHRKLISFGQVKKDVCVQPKETFLKCVGSSKDAQHFRKDWKLNKFLSWWSHISLSKYDRTLNVTFTVVW